MEWIKCSNQMPEDDDIVLLANSRFQIITVGFYMGPERVMRPGFWTAYFEPDETLDVSHWMPLPVAPKD